MLEIAIRRPWRCHLGETAVRLLPVYGEQEQDFVVLLVLTCVPQPHDALTDFVQDRPFSVANRPKDVLDVFRLDRDHARLDRSASVLMFVHSPSTYSEVHREVAWVHDHDAVSGSFKGLLYLNVAIQHLPLEIHWMGLFLEQLLLLTNKVRIRHCVVS